MKRLTTNCPDNNLDAALNLFYVKDFETWVRGGGDGPDYPDIRLYDFIRKAAKILLPDLDFPMDDDGVDYAMGELLLDGPDEPTGLLALLYTAAWSYAELRGRLMQYEDTGLEPAMCANYKTFEDEAISKGVTFKRIVELMEADRAGRLVVLPVRPVLTQSIGSMLYIIEDGEIVEDSLCEALVGMGSNGEINIFYTTLSDQISFEQADIGKTVFLTREDAEKTRRAMGLWSMSISGFFPVGRRHSFMPPEALEDGWQYVSFFERNRPRKLPFRVILLDGDGICRLNSACTVDNFSWQVQRNGDIAYTLELREYRFISGVK